MKILRTIPLWVVIAFAALTLLIETPWIALPFFAGGAYQSINIMQFGTDEHYYLSRANAGIHERRGEGIYNAVASAWSLVAYRCAYALQYSQYYRRVCAPCAHLSSGLCNVGKCASRSRRSDVCDRGVSLA